MPRRGKALAAFLCQQVLVNSPDTDVTKDLPFLIISNLYVIPQGDISPIVVSLFVTIPDDFTIAAVPETSTWLMMIVGFCGIGALIRRRRSAELIAGIMLAVSWTAQAHADLVIPLGTDANIMGPFSPDPSVNIQVILDVERTNVPLPFIIPSSSTGVYVGFFVDIYLTAGGSSIIDQVCGGNVPGPCGGGFTPIGQNFLYLNKDNHTLEAISSGLVFLSSISNQVFPDADPYFEVVTSLSDDFTIAVPEPSTWAMLLIGFAAVGFAGYRKARRESFV
jgi:hypothetical protein